MIPVTRLGYLDQNLVHTWQLHQRDLQANVAKPSCTMSCEQCSGHSCHFYLYIVVRSTPCLSEAWRDLTLSQNFRSCLPRMNCGQPTPMDFPLSVAPKCFHCSRIVLTIFLLKTFRLCSFRPNKIIQPCPNSKNPPIVNHSKSQRHFPTSASMGRERFSASQTKWRQFRELLNAKEWQNNQHVNENEGQVIVHTKQLIWQSFSKGSQVALSKNNPSASICLQLIVKLYCIPTDNIVTYRRATHNR